MNYIIHYDIAAAVLSLFILFYILRMKGLRVVSNRFFSVFTAAASVAFRIVFSNILTEIFVQSLGLLGILFSIENKDNIIDQTTDVFNRY